MFKGSFWGFMVPGHRVLGYSDSMEVLGDFGALT